MTNVYEGPTYLRNGISDCRVEITDKIITSIKHIARTNKTTLLMSGILDSHQHWRDWNQSSKETVYSASMHALTTGTLEAKVMGNTDLALVNVDNLRRYNAFLENSLIPVRAIPLITPSSKTSTLLEMGPYCDFHYKVFQDKSVGDVFFGDNEKMIEVLINEVPNIYEIKNYLASNPELIKHLTVPVDDLQATISYHLEDPAELKRYAHLWNPDKPWTHFDARPNIVEETGVTLVVDKLMAEVEATHLIRHVSSAGSLPIINEGKRSGYDLLAETCYQYLFFNNGNFNTEGYKIKCNPSIKTREDQLALIKAVNNGQIDLLSSDHAPHTNEEKMNKAFSGMPSYNCGALGWLINQEGFNPANVLNAYSLKLRPEWEIKEGNKARLIIIDTKPSTVTEKDNCTLAWKSSPWIGKELPHCISIIK